MAKFKVRTITTFPLVWDDLEAASIEAARDRAKQYADNCVCDLVSTVRTQVVKVEQIEVAITEPAPQRAGEE